MLRVLSLSPSAGLDLGAFAPACVGESMGWSGPAAPTVSRGGGGGGGCSHGQAVGGWFFGRTDGGGPGDCPRFLVDHRAAPREWAALPCNEGAFAAPPGEHERWMEDNWGALQDRTLLQLTLPGSHNSGNNAQLGSGPACPGDNKYRQYLSATADSSMSQADFDTAFLPWCVCCCGRTHSNAFSRRRTAQPPRIASV